MPRGAEHFLSRLNTVLPAGVFISFLVLRHAEFMAPSETSLNLGGSLAYPGRHRACIPIWKMLQFPRVVSERSHSPPSFTLLLTLLLATLALLPFTVPSDLASHVTLESERRHDVLNALALTPLALGLVGSLCCVANSFAVTLGLAFYACLDATYILCNPDCVRHARVILGHHLVTLIFVLVPLHHPDLSDFTALAGCAEVETLVLTVRRVLRGARGAWWSARKRRVSAVLDWLHVVLFVVVRLVFHPIFFIGAFSCMHIPHPEGVTVVVCQGALVGFNAVLAWRELKRFRRRARHLQQTDGPVRLGWKGTYGNAWSSVAAASVPKE